MSELLARFADREETIYSAELYLLRKVAQTSSDMVSLWHVCKLTQ